jgi:phosphonoacetaldehyde hydrolase
MSETTRLEMVVMDWAGTAVDFGSVAPIIALEQVFAWRNITVSRPLLRLSMGIAKKDHIREVLAIPEIAKQWAARFGVASTEQDVEALYADFTPRMMDEIEASATLIPGVAAFAEAIRARGLKHGATTGYTRPMMERLMAGAAKQGYAPEISLCPEDAGGGRPHPWMCCRLAIDLRVSALWASVKIGDTESDIAEGRNAGMWTIGVTTTGNEVGLSLNEWLALDIAQQQAARELAATKLLAAGAHYVIDAAADSLPVLDEIDVRLAHGERP